jgi:hypothetical protein
MCVSAGRIYQRFLSRSQAIHDLRGARGCPAWDLEDDPPTPSIELPHLDSEHEWQRISNETLARAYFERIGESVTVLDSAIS